MKRIAMIAGIAVLLSSGVVYAERSVSVDHVTNTWDSGTKLWPSRLHEIHIRLTNTGAPPGNDIPSNYNIYNGFRLYSPDGAEWCYPIRDTFIQVVIPDILVNTFIDSILWADNSWRESFDVAFGRVYFSTDGEGADTIGYVAATSTPSQGLVAGTDEVGFIIPIRSFCSSDGRHICIDSSWFPPGGTWKWAPVSGDTQQIGPLWSGSACWTVSKPPCLPDPTEPHCWPPWCCCFGATGAIDDLPEGPDIGDLTRLIDYLYGSADPIFCVEEANVDGDAAGGVDIGDLTALIRYLYIDETPLAPCPPWQHP
jgi:hypothetical protein